MGSRENLSMSGLPSLIGDQEFTTEVATLVNEALEKSAFARDWRNRHIAHRDRALALDDNAAALAFASRASVESAIQSISVIVERVHERYLGSGIYLELSGTLGDASDLLRVLQEGVAAQKARARRFESDQWTEDDLAPRPAI